MNTVLTYVSILLLTTAACEKDKTVRTARPTPPARVQIAGMGTGNDQPVGELFRLPEGLKLQGIHGGNCETPEAQRFGMSYARVALCISLQNTTLHPIKLTLPAGLVFVAASATVKNGLVPKSITFTVPAAANMHVRIGALCMNAGRDMPESDDHYSIGPVYEHAPLKNFYALFSRKRIYENDTRQHRDFDAAIIAQSLFWKLCDSTGLNTDDIALANSLTDI
ncbi:hypothetical protein MKQ70_08370 [Chitinophaga sedimenti]|uniref:hypothetical protein n=1 Tax=Chitinophaga sedimenti TaxID=2033606 RepID=UPI002004D1B6|nr:hypothetical protein [Chitinophaga sedimenti]MCK7555020.1 hypothetical protein [Chitinophaga sedimenti]